LSKEGQAGRDHSNTQPREQGQGSPEGAPSSKNKDIAIEQLKQFRSRLEELIHGLSREDKKKLKSNLEIFLSGKTLYRDREKRPLLTPSKIPIYIEK
jgi:hypothetical protein